MRILTGITPTLCRINDTGTVVVTDPPRLAGRVVVRVDARPCLADTGAGTACGLVVSHTGECWACDRQFIDTSGPWALTVTDETP